MVLYVVVSFLYIYILLGLNLRIWLYILVLLWRGVYCLPAGGSHPSPFPSPCSPVDKHRVMILYTQKPNSVLTDLQNASLVYCKTEIRSSRSLWRLYDYHTDLRTRSRVSCLVVFSSVYLDCIFISCKVRTVFFALTSCIHWFTWWFDLFLSS